MTRWDMKHNHDNIKKNTKHARKQEGGNQDISTSPGGVTGPPPRFRRTRFMGLKTRQARSPAEWGPAQCGHRRTVWAHTSREVRGDEKKSHCSQR